MVSDPKGDGSAFDENWRTRPETSYLHWTKGDPVNQIQLAFRRHWITFNQLLEGKTGNKRCLEVGCGRGSLSAYFADNGWDCTLLDLSEAAIQQAQSAFKSADLAASFDVGDCLNLPYEDDSYDLAFSIGLLEHFKDFNKVIQEQVRVLVPEGLFIGYVVPYLPDCVQKEYEWVNNILRAVMPSETAEAENGKAQVYRSDALSPPYLEVMKNTGLHSCRAEGIYPLPMISHSPSFPFSLLPVEAEINLVKTFELWLKDRQDDKNNDPWRCEEGYGQAFLVWGRKT